jgi:hypothetical protein
MSPASTNTSNTPASRVVRRPGEQGDTPLFVNAGVHEGVAVTLCMRTPDVPGVTLMFGDERLTLEFLDVESLERLRDLADEGARRLRAAFETAAGAAQESAAPGLAGCC